MLEREQVPKDYCTYCLGVPVMFTIEVMNGIVFSTITSQCSGKHFTYKSYVKLKLAQAFKGLNEIVTQHFYKTFSIVQINCRTFLRVKCCYSNFKMKCSNFKSRSLQMKQLPCIKQYVLGQRLKTRYQ